MYVHYSNTMKSSYTYRLTENTIDTLTKLSEELNTSKTNIIEESVKYYARTFENKVNKHPLSRFVGVLTDKEAEKMKKDISISRKSKDLSAIKL